MNLRSIDLNLLVVFDAIFKEKNITKAGLRVGLSQPAVSNALTRLRGHLGDELFLRGTDVLRPTARAIELSGPIHAMLADLEKVLEPATFNPRKAQRIFTIATADYFSLKVAPNLVIYLEKHAPGIDVRFVPGTLNAFELLDQGDLDVAVFPYKNPPARFGIRTLFQDSFSCMMASDHPLAKRELTLRRFAAARHLVISLNGDSHGVIDQILARDGLTRRVAMTVNQYSVAQSIIENTDLIVTAPTKILEDSLSRKIMLKTCPIKFPKLHGHVDMFWHKRLGSHPAQVWFRETLANLATNPGWSS
jgi:DNA-binding transcriptional LysR family regulator